MSPESAEVVRQAYKAYNAGDLAAFGALLHADVVMHHVEGWPEPGPSVGRDAVLLMIEQLRDAFEGDTLEPTTDFVEGTGCVIARDVWRGSGSGPEADFEFTRIFTVRKGLITCIEIFRDHAEALAAVGLSE
jgi:ketosteroid isomerase-like protein